MIKPAANFMCVLNNTTQSLVKPEWFTFKTFLYLLKREVFPEKFYCNIKK